MLTLSGFVGYSMAARVNRYTSEPAPLDRDVLIVPDVLIEDFDSTIASKVRPVFDMVWNSAGWSESQNYDEQGNWTL